MRITLVLLNLAAFLRPQLTIGGRCWLAFDIAGLPTACSLLALTLVAGVRGTRALVRREGWAPRGGALKGDC